MFVISRIGNFRLCCLFSMVCVFVRLLFFWRESSEYLVHLYGTYFLKLEQLSCFSY